jgi:hypothetical protein
VKAVMGGRRGGWLGYAPLARARARDSPCNDDIPVRHIVHFYLHTAGFPAVLSKVLVVLHRHILVSKDHHGLLWVINRKKGGGVQAQLVQQRLVNAALACIVISIWLPRRDR